MTTDRKTSKFIREGAYIAEVEVTLIETEHEWAPFVEAADVRKLDEVRLALRRGDLSAAAKFGKVYQLTPVAAE